MRSFPCARDYDLGILAWGPLAHGVLADRYTDAAKLPEGSRGTLKTIYRDRITREGIEVGMKIVKRSEEKGCTAAQFAVAWVLYQPGVSCADSGTQEPGAIGKPAAGG